MIAVKDQLSDRWQVRLKSKVEPETPVFQRKWLAYGHDQSILMYIDKLAAPEFCRLQSAATDLDHTLCPSSQSTKGLVRYKSRNIDDGDQSLTLILRNRNEHGIHLVQPEGQDGRRQGQGDA
ncbi:MAG: hypothetical protein EBU88_12615, partial [Acidobacteria bacterium]|nr:hypothetical protein [Acidobacteriota bacterium]